MPRPPLLNDDDTQFLLGKCPLWRLIDTGVPPRRIERDILAANWLAAIGIVNAIALVAESMDHHPDLNIYAWNKIRVSCTTHDQGGLTELDFDLANKIDGLSF